MFRAYSTKVSNAIPKPSNEITDVSAFLKSIGRNCVEYVEAFPTWDALFTSSGREMKAAGIDTTKRKYILHQVEVYRQSGNVSPTPLSRKINGGERKLNQHLAKKRVLERIQLAKDLKAFRKQQNATTSLYNKFEKLHENETL